MEDAKNIVKDASVRFKDVLVQLGKNYIQCAIAGGLEPVFTTALSELADDAKSQLGKKEEKEDKLGDSKGAEITDIFAIELDSCTVIMSWAYSFTAYTVFCIRVGHDKDGAFFSLAKKYQITYNVLKKMHSNLKDEMKDGVPDLPPDAKHGQYCCCLTYKPDMNATQSTMKTYLSELSKKYFLSKSLAHTFYLGDKWVQQQRSKEIFDEAFSQTRNEVVKGGYIREIDPFDEGEAVNQLLRNIARNEVLPKVREKIPKLPVCQGRVDSQFTNLVLSAVDGAYNASWPPAQKAVDEVKLKVQEMVDKGADTLVEQLKPLLQKIVELVKSKLEKKEEKNEKEESKKKTEIGDFVKNWRFENTDIGKAFYGGLGNEDAKNALDKLSNNLNDAINTAIEKRLQSNLQKLLGEKASWEIVQLIIKEVADQATSVVKRFTTITPLMNASKTFFDVRADFESKLKAAKSNADSLNKAIDEGSLAFWRTMPRIGIVLFKDMENVKSQINSELSKLTEEARSPLLEVADSLYQFQMKAINSVRAKLVVKLKANVNSLVDNEQAIVDTLRNTFRELVFNNIQVLVNEAWTSVAEAIIQSAIVQVGAKFDEMVWEKITPGLDALQQLIPEPIAKLGLEIPKIAHKVADVLIEKTTTYVVGKLVIKLEEILFNQASQI